MTTGLTTSTNFIAQKIDRNMVDSVKDAIFQRAASKSAQVVENSAANNVYNTDTYKTSVQNEVMNEARRSFRPSVNPFANGFVNNLEQAQAATANVTEEKSSAGAISKNAFVKTSGKSRVAGTMALQNSMYTSAVRESMMIQAKEEMIKSPDLMSRLQFLNTKTAISAYPAKQFA